VSRSRAFNWLWKFNSYSYSAAASISSMNIDPRDKIDLAAFRPIAPVDFSR
jgi:hypothetical protein